MRSTIILLSFISALIIVAVAAGVLKKTEAPSRKEDVSAYERFSAENVLVKSFDPNGPLFILSADKIIRRDRTSYFFRYRNLDELYFSNLAINLFAERDLFSDKSIPEVVRNVLSEHLGGMFKKDNDVVMEGKADDISTVTAVSDYKLITRAVIDNFLMHLHLKNGKSLKFSSGNAVINFTSHDIEFKKNFSITDALHEKITAPEAVWLHKSNLICLPAGYAFSPSGHKGTAFFFINNAGELKEAKAPINAGRKTDRIYEMEKAMTAKYLAPYLNAFYTSLLTKGKMDFSPLKKQ